MPGSGSPAGARGRAYAGRSLEDRREDQYRRLIEAARDAFATKGWAAASVEDIVGSAHVSRTAFYRFFDSREACLEAVFREGTERLRQALDAVADSELEPAEMIEAGVRAFVETLAGDPKMARIILIEAVGASPSLERARHEVRVGFAEVIERQVLESGVWEGQPEAELRLTAHATMAGLAEAVEYMVATDSFEDAPGVIDALGRYAVRALTPPV